MRRPIPLKVAVLAVTLAALWAGQWAGLWPSPAMQSAPHVWQPTAGPSPNGPAPVPVLTNTQATQSGAMLIHDADTIRVGISDDAMEAFEYPATTISATVPFVVLHQGNVIFKGAPAQPVGITVNNEGFALNVLPGQRFAGPLTAQPASLLAMDTARMTIPNITRKKVMPEYRGILEITRGYSSPSKLSVVNILPLQEYLKAVVPNELPPRYGFEAVKAQSVAARNYAIRPREATFPQFDICDSQLCQVYFGAHTEHAASNQALQETQGLVALYEGRPILALYSSAHGGHSEDYANAFSDPSDRQFPGTPVPYLQGKPDIAPAAAPYGDLRIEENARRFWTTNTIADFDGKSSYHRWEFVWPIKEVNVSLNAQWAKLMASKSTGAFLTSPVLPVNLSSMNPLQSPEATTSATSTQPTNQPLGNIQRITVVQRGVSGKAMMIALDTDKGRFTARKEFILRKLLTVNGKMLPSANVVFAHLTDANGQLTAIQANGGGFGHGVGMSQLGASTLAERATSFDRILQHYYSGVTIGSIPVSVGAWQAGLAHTEPQRVTFSLPRSGGLSPQVMVQLPYNAPAPKVLLNGKVFPLPLATSSSAANNQQAPWLTGITRLLTTGKADPELNTLRVPIPAGWLASSQLNQLVLYPQAQQPQTPYRVWVELIPQRTRPLG